MKWKQEFELGIAMIDTQHKQLFRLNEELHNNTKEGLKGSTINTLLTQLKQYAARHFTMEEKYMADINYPGIQEQKKEHATFTTRFSEIQEDFNEQGITPAIIDLINNELLDWLIKHITGMDQALGEYYRKHRSDAP